MQQNNQEQIFCDWVKKAKYEDLVKSFNNSCLEKKKIVQEEINKRFYKQDKEIIDFEQKYKELHDVLIHYCESLNYSTEEIKESLPIQLVYKIFQKTEEYKKAQEKINSWINESDQQLFDFCLDGPYCPKISVESLERRINRKLP
mgnify:CR=1 FL=1